MENKSMSAHPFQHLKQASSLEGPSAVTPPPGVSSIQEGGIKYRWYLSQGSATSSLIPTLLVWPMPSNADVGAYITNGIEKMQEVFGSNINMKILFQSVSYGLYELTSPLTLSPNITLEFEPGATLIFSGGNINFNGCELIAGRYPIFLHNEYWPNYSQGRLSENKETVNNAIKYLSVYNIFGQVSCKETYPEWFGAVGDWSYVDDIFATKYAMFFAATHTNSKTLSFANKTYHVCGSYSHGSDPNNAVVPAGDDFPASHLNAFDDRYIKLMSPSQIQDGSSNAIGHLTGLRIIGEPGATIKSTSFTYSYEPNNATPLASTHLRRDDFGKHLYFELTNVALVQGIKFIDVGLVLRNQEIDDDGSTPLNPPQLSVKDCKFEITQDWGNQEDYRTQSAYGVNSPHRIITKAIMNNWPNRCIQVSNHADATVNGHSEYFPFFGHSLLFKYKPAHKRPVFCNNVFLQTNGYQAVNDPNDGLRFYGTYSKKAIGIVGNLLDEALVENNFFEGLHQAMFINGSINKKHLSE